MIIHFKFKYGSKQSKGKMMDVALKIEIALPDDLASKWQGLSQVMEFELTTYIQKIVEDVLRNRFNDIKAIF